MIEYRRFADVSQCANGIAHALLSRLKQLLEIKSEVHIAITGGTLGIASLAAVAAHPELNSVDWPRVHIWWGDERFVESNSSDRNALQAKNALLHLIPSAILHEFPSADGGAEVEVAAQAFSTEVARYFVAGQPRFDITLLGMGPDGHVASLFPGKATPPIGASVIAVLESPKPPPQRLSFTYEALNTSEEVWFLVAGREKAEATASSANSEELPAGNVKGKTKTIWFVDEAAASLLS